MSDYTLYFTSTASTTVTVAADNLDDAIDKAYDELPGGVCAHCAGFMSDKPGIDLSGEWDLDEGAAQADYPQG